MLELQKEGQKHALVAVIRVGKHSIVTVNKSVATLITTDTQRSVLSFFARQEERVAPFIHCHRRTTILHLSRFFDNNHHQTSRSTTAMESEERQSSSSRGISSPTAAATGSPSNVNSIVRQRPSSAADTPAQQQQQQQQNKNHPPPHKEDTNSDNDNNNRGGGCLGGCFQNVAWDDVFYIATWGVFGAVTRIYVDRLFGMDCETDPDDFWRAQNVCITATGLTERRGGALFVDLPANVLGSFLMGLLSASSEHVIPWFPRHHHLQRQTSWHKGLTTGFCGCLTTCK